MSDTPQIVGGELTYAQPGESITMSGVELLTVTHRDEGAGAFFVIKTDGWAFDKIEELVAVLQDAAQRLNIEEASE